MLFKEVSAKTNDSECINKAIEELIGEVFYKMELDYESFSENKLMSLHPS